MVNESDKIIVSGIDYYPIPDYSPLAISRCGKCINVETMKNLKWSSSVIKTAKNQWFFFRVNARGDLGKWNKTVTLSRALALCFIPIPKEIKHIPVEKLSAIYREKISTIEEASNLKNILWVEHENESVKRSLTVINLNTGEKTDHVNMLAASAHLKLHKSTLGTYFRIYGPHFKYKHYQVSVAFDEGEDFSHCKKQKGVNAT
jgi:hypothetical protein